LPDFSYFDSRLFLNSVNFSKLPCHRFDAAKPVINAYEKSPVGSNVHSRVSGIFQESGVSPAAGLKSGQFDRIENLTA
jgi:hypothetical protein